MHEAEGIEPAEEWKSPRHMQHCPRAAEVRGTNCVKWLTSIFQSVWSTGVIPDDWLRGIICPSTEERAAGTTARTIEASHYFLSQARCLPTSYSPE